MSYYEFMTMLRENITNYELSDDRCLTITHPYTGKSITLDFNLMDEEMFEQLRVEEE